MLTYSLYFLISYVVKFYWWLVIVTLVVTFGSLLQKFGRQRGPMQWRIQDFPRGGGANSQKCYYFSIFCWKLHENERIWTPRGGARPWRPPWIRQCYELSFCSKMNAAWVVWTIVGGGDTQTLLVKAIVNFMNSEAVGMQNLCDFPWLSSASAPVRIILECILVSWWLYLVNRL